MDLNKNVSTMRHACKQNRIFLNILNFPAPKRRRTLNIKRPLPSFITPVSLIKRKGQASSHLSEETTSSRFYPRYRVETNRRQYLDEPLPDQKSPYRARFQVKKIDGSLPEPLMTRNPLSKTNGARNVICWQACNQTVPSLLYS